MELSRKTWGSRLDVKGGTGTLPQGISQKQFNEASKLVRNKVGNISDDIVLAQNVRKRAYAKYSDYCVGAVLTTKNGKKYTGCNIENYGIQSICAERNAIFSAISHGYHKGDFQELYVMVSSGEVGMPCFLCRQVISEFFSDNIGQQLSSEKSWGTVSPQSIAIG